MSTNYRFFVLVSEEEVIDKLGSRMVVRSYHKPKPQRNFGKSIHIPECTKDQCTEQSMNMSRMMKKTADPCKDFYEYACGGWIDEGLPPDQAKWTIFALLAEQTENKLKSLIEGQKNSGTNNFYILNVTHSLFWISLMSRKTRMTSVPEEVFHIKLTVVIISKFVDW